MPKKSVQISLHSGMMDMHACVSCQIGTDSAPRYSILQFAGHKKVDL